MCQNFTPPPTYVPTMKNPLLDHEYGMMFIVEISSTNAILGYDIKHEKWSRGKGMGVEF